MRLDGFDHLEAIAVKAAHDCIEQVHPRSNVSNLRPKAVYDGAGDDIRTAAMDVWSWSALIVWCEKDDAPEGVKAAARELRARLTHPAQP